MTTRKKTKKGVVLGVYVSEEDAALIRSLAAKDKRKVSDWMRLHVLRAVQLERLQARIDEEAAR
jgi:hypothetical protein